MVLKPTSDDVGWDETGDVVYCTREVWDEKDTERCHWHAEIEGKTVANLPESRTDENERLDGAVLTGAELGDTDRFTGTHLNNADLSNANLMNADLTGTNFTDADLSDAFLGGAELVNADLGGADLSKAALWNADLTNAILAHSDLTDVHLSYVDLTNAILSHTTIIGGDLENSDLTSANLQNTTLIGALLDNAVTTDLQIDGHTTFLGDGNHWWQDKLCGYDPRYVATTHARAPGDDVGYSLVEHLDRKDRLDKAANTYRIIEDLASENARPRLQATCYIRRQDIRRMQHAHAARTTDSWIEYFVSSAKWGLQWGSWGIMKYGESPWRVVYTSLAVIALCGAAYSMFDLTDAPTLGANEYFSVVTFTTLGYGDYQPTEGAGELLAGVESLVGAILLALLVAVLARRLMR